MRPPLLTGLLFLSVGCFTSVYAEQIGRPYPPQSPSCPVVFDYFDDKGQARIIAEGYTTQVGVLELAHGTDHFVFTDDIKTKLRPEACKLGGNFVAYSHWEEGSLATGMVSKFLVYRRDAPNDAGPAAP